MEEAQVVSIICEYLQENNYSFWIEDLPIHNNYKFSKIWVNYWKFST